MAATQAVGVLEHQYPYPILTKTEKRPTALWVQTIEQQLLENAMSVANPGAAEAGWSKLVMDNTEYEEAFPTCNFNIPDAPAGNASQITLKRWQTMKTIDNELKKQLRASFDTKYMADKIATLPIARRRFGLTAFTTKVIMETLRTEYGKMKPADIEENRDNLRGVANSTAPIEDIWQKVQAIQNIADKAGKDAGQDDKHTIDESTILTLVITSMKTDGGYKEMLEAWSTKDKATREADDAWSKFKKHCNEWEEEHRDKITTGTEGYVNSTQHKVPSTAPATNTDDNVSQITDHTISTPGKNMSTPNKKPRYTALALFMHNGRNADYCWSHGICWHSGTKCPKPKDGHKNEATLFERHGGSDKIAQSILNFDPAKANKRNSS